MHARRALWPVWFAIWLLAACAGDKPIPPPPTETFLKFPAGFLWGTATAAYQIEGGIVNSWSKAGLDAIRDSLDF